MAPSEKLRPGYLRTYGFTAPTIIDVGVLFGTPFLYNTFPDRHFILIDPLEESRAVIAKRWADLRYDFHTCALGDAPRRIELEIDRHRLSRTSGGHRLADDVTHDSRQVEVRTLDSITADLPGPFGLKIDTEGHELAVLRGAVQTLRRCEVVLAEISIKKRFEDGYRFSEAIALMAENGFEVYSFMSGLTKDPRMADILFIPTDSPRFDMISKDTDAPAKGPSE